MHSNGAHCKTRALAYLCLNPKHLWPRWQPWDGTGVNLEWFPGNALKFPGNSKNNVLPSVFGAGVNFWCFREMFFVAT